MVSISTATLRTSSSTVHIHQIHHCHNSLHSNHSLTETDLLKLNCEKSDIIIFDPKSLTKSNNNYTLVLGKLKVSLSFLKKHNTNYISNYYYHAVNITRKLLWPYLLWKSQDVGLQPQVTYSSFCLCPIWKTCRTALPVALLLLHSWTCSSHVHFYWSCFQTHTSGLSPERLFVWTQMSSFFLDIFPKKEHKYLRMKKRCQTHRRCKRRCRESFWW